MKEGGHSVAVLVGSVAALAAEFPADVDGWLTDGERQRLVSITSAQRSRQFLSGHWLLRSLAAERFGGNAQEWSVMASNDRSPVLRSEQQGRDVHSSLSHCGDMVAAAIAKFPIGIDVERPSKPRNLMAIADVTFSVNERAELQRLPEQERIAAFYLFWTLKEATGKRQGHGLRPELACLQQPIECSAETADISSWQFADCSLSLAGETGMSVSAAGLPKEAKRRYWRIERRSFRMPLADR
jgi:4'-phosphopantetheinyl transferase